MTLVVLDDFIYSYNHTYHRSIKMRPVDVKKSNENKVFINLYGIRELKKIKPKFKIGDRVRISKNKMQFEKGYTNNWSHEIFTIFEIIPREIVVYRIRDLADEEIHGVFYEEELQKVTKSDEVYLVEKIVKQRKTKKGIEYLVKWLGYPDKFNSWIRAEDLQ